MTEGITVTVRAPDAEAFAPFGVLLEPPHSAGGRAMFNEFLDPVPGRAPQYHLNRVAPTELPVTIDRVERHRHAAQLFLPIGVPRYLVTVMPSDELGNPDPVRTQAFVIPGTVGVAYHPGTWHAGISVLDAEGSFAVMMWRSGEDDDDFASVAPVDVLAAPAEQEAVAGG